MDTVAASHVERHAARSAQKQVELERLAAHQKKGIELLRASPRQQRKLIEAVLHEVGRWEDLQLCSADYIRRWRAWLALPVNQLVSRMCSDEEWGCAMRQNSPFTAADAP